MTKLNSGKMIVIKINGERRTFHEDKEIIEADIVENSLPDTPAPVSDVTNNETAASKEIADDSFEWILPETEEQNEHKDLGQPRDEGHFAVNPKKRTISLNLKPIILSVIFAVLVGTGFGIIMLKLVSTEQPKQSAPAAPAAPINDKNPAQASSSGPSNTLKSWTAYVVQGGVYASKESVKSVISLDAGDGVPADSIEIDGMHYILIGISDTMEGAKSLGSSLKAQGITDIYPRPLTIPEKKLTNLNADEKAFLKTAASLFPFLTKSTSESGSSGGLTTKTMNTIKELKTNIEKINVKNGKLKDLQKEITAASEKLISYQKTNDSKTLAAAQQHLLTFLSIYYSL